MHTRISTCLFQQRVSSLNSLNALSKAKLLFPKCPNIPKGWGCQESLFGVQTTTTGWWSGGLRSLENVQSFAVFLYGFPDLYVQVLHLESASFSHSSSLRYIFENNNNIQLILVLTARIGAVHWFGLQHIVSHTSLAIKRAVQRLGGCGLRSCRHGLTWRSWWRGNTSLRLSDEQGQGDKDWGRNHSKIRNAWSMTIFSIGKAREDLLVCCWARANSSDVPPAQDCVAGCGLFILTLIWLKEFLHITKTMQITPALFLPY